LNDKNTRHSVLFVLRFPSTLRSPQLSFRVTSDLTCSDCSPYTPTSYLWLRFSTRIQHNY